MSTAAVTFNFTSRQPPPGNEVRQDFDDLIGFINQINPSGLIQMYGGSTAPTGWLLCDGTAVSRTTYAALFTAISTTFGVGDGSTTFNIPDMRGVFPKGAGTTTRAAGVDASGTAYAATLGAYAQDQEQGHKHSVDPPSTVSSGQSATHHHTSSNNGNMYFLDGTASNYQFGASANSGNGSISTAQSTGDASADHTHTVDIAAFDSAVQKTDGTNGTPRVGHTTEPQSLGLTYIIKT